MRPTPPVCPPPPAAADSLSYYPARHTGTFATVREALAAIGCPPAEVAPVMAHACAESAELVAVPVSASDGFEALALVRPEPTGRAALLIGLPTLARPTAAEAAHLAALLKRTTAGAWFVVACVPRVEALQ
jgi:hypothetical protein